ncbi:toll-like receptor Tollo [Culicoides brevitarsis]|uniref:toll-like receptor Tollo n=1 Tax=Culicoides brevitarsis TaxID=469753 RepID=UPI00307C374B
MMFMVGNLDAGHANVAQQEQLANQCKWEILNNSTGERVTAAEKRRGGDAFKFVCTIFAPFAGTRSVLAAIERAANIGFKERDFDKIHELTLECNSTSNNTADLLHFHANNNINAVDNSAEVVDIAFESIGKRLPNLREIHFTRCQVKRLPDLMFHGYFRETLTTLTIQSDASKSSQTTNLELYSGTFKGLDRLRHLNLAYNNIWSVPSYIFCMTPSLEHLNLSHNSLTELTQLEFGTNSNCTHQLKMLDVSFNKIIYIASNDLTSLTHLKTFFASNNALHEIYEHGLSGLAELETLDLTHNRLVALPAALFKNCCRNLRTLRLRNNSLSVLTPSIFDALLGLDELDLSFNYFTTTWINGFIFARLTELRVMLLANNSLQRIDEFLFYDLKKLETLELQNNEINVVHEKAFQHTTALKYLNFGFNRLRSLNGMGFPNGSALLQVSFSSNSITNVDQKFFRELKNLEDLNLSNNLLTELPSGLGFLTQLKSLDLGKNNIHTLDGKKFIGLERLLGLRMVDNYLTNLSHSALQHLPSLQILNLASNHLKHIDKQTFLRNTQIHVIRLNNNRLEVLPSGIFRHLRMLMWLDIGFNHLTEYNFHQNAPPTLQELNLQSNRLTHVHAFVHLPKNLIINLKDNRLERIERNAVRITNETNEVRDTGGEKIKLYLQGNPLICDCHTQWLRDANYDITTPQILDIQNVSCIIKRQLRQREENLMSIVDRYHTKFLCEYASHCTRQCYCCEFDACDCKFTCPPRCECFHDELWQLNIVDCGRAEYFDVPKHLPMDATDIYLDGNDMGMLGEHLFIGKKNLEVLFLNTSQITGINNRTFVGANKLKKLYLQNNFIKTIENAMFETLEHLRELYLESNLIESIPDERIFLNHSHLRIINLSSNQLKRLDFINRLPPSTILASAFFKDNPYDCTTCVDTSSSHTDIRRIIKLLRKICPMTKCEYILPPTNLLLPSSSSSSQHTEMQITSTDVFKREYLQLWAGILVAIIGTTFLLALACNFRANVVLYLYKRHKIRVYADPTVRLDVHKSCDATILFNTRDSEFIYRILSVQLENRGFDLEYQNNVLGPAENDIQVIDTFVACAETSRRIILILSANFLNTEYRNKTFQTALKNYLYRLDVRLRPYRLILVLSVPLEILLVDPVLEEMIRTCTVLFWGETQFWEKLNFAMPDATGRIGRTHKSPVSRKMLMQVSNNGTPTTMTKAKNAITNTTTVDIMPQMMPKTTNAAPPDNETDDNLSFSGLSQTQSYKFYNAQTYVNKATGHIYTTIDSAATESQVIKANNISDMTSNNNGLEVAASNKGSNGATCIRDIAMNGKAYYV